jgi:hypothetical protein
VSIESAAAAIDPARQARRRELFQTERRTIMNSRTVVVGLFSAMLLAACDGGYHEYRSPTAPAPEPANQTTWLALVTVMSLSPGQHDCIAWSAGESTANLSVTMSEAGGRLRISGMLQGNYSPLAYEGARDGNRFTATSGDDGGFGCFLWSASISGTFSEDGRNFEAAEHLDYHSPTGPNQTVERRWTASKQ